MKPALRVIQQGQSDVEKAYLERVISALTETRVLLADDVFVFASEISVARNLDLSARPGMTIDRIVGSPNHFRLYILEGHCLLEHVESSEIIALEGLKCNSENGQQ